MPESTLLDLESGNTSHHQSSLPLWSVSDGPDLALDFIKACHSTDPKSDVLKVLLAEPQTVKLALEEQNVVYYEERRPRNDSDLRDVIVAPFINLRRALNKAANYNCAESVRVLLDFAVQKCGVDLQDLIDPILLIPVIKDHQAHILEPIVTAYPPASTLNLGDCGLPLDLALGQVHMNIVTVLLEHGVDIRSTTRPCQRSKWSDSMLFLGVGISGTRLLELLIEQGFPVAASGALHHAAERGSIGAMQFLIDRGADPNELLPSNGIQGEEAKRILLASWTPMHAAASKRQLDALAFLLRSGGREDVRDGRGRTPHDVLKTSEATLDALSPFPSIYASTRGMWEVLLGEDLALPLTEASLADDLGKLRELLADPKTVELALEKQHTIYSRDDPRADKPMPDGWRSVSAMPMTNLNRVITLAAVNGHAEAVTMLLAFAKDKWKIKLSDLVDRMFIVPVVRNRQTAVFDAVVAAYPNTVKLDLGHWGYTLDLVVNFRQWDMVATVLEHGVDPNGVTRNRRPRGSYPSSWLCWTAGARSLRFTEVLVTKHNLPVNGSGALHRAAELGAIEIMEFLLGHGADVNEVLPEEGINSSKKALHVSWTPMHFAASRGEVEAMEVLRTHGASENVRDVEGRTAEEVLDQRSQQEVT